MTKSIECFDEPNAVVIKITGAAFENLKRITEVFNRWDNAEYSPAEFLFEHEIKTNQPLTHLAETDPGEYHSTLPGAVCQIYWKAPDVEKLREAFAEAGLAVRS